MPLYLTETLRELWSERLGNEVGIYCQGCGTELTKKGGDVSASGGVYCDDKIECAVARTRDSLSLTAGPSIIYYFVSPNRLQRLVEKGKVTNFGPLERKTVSN
ncbi:hypothetical protein HYX17_04930 [Candidatus Woesearchaeota archaeon]|nr:hypothetical protein [Candidatus Woesearchaeota archaeon]